jgi:hypothetical protein
MKARPVLSSFSILAARILFFSSTTAYAQSEHASSAEKPPVSFTPGERAWLASHPGITLAGCREGEPYGFVNERSGYIGVIPDMTERIETLPGIRIQFKPVEYGMLPDDVMSCRDASENLKKVHGGAPTVHHTT